jgi:hypothetical protein
MEAGWQNAYDLMDRAVDGNDTTHDLWIAGITASPQLIADQHDLVPSWDIFLGEEHAPQLRLSS